MRHLTLNFAFILTAILTIPFSNDASSEAKKPPATHAATVLRPPKVLGTFTLQDMSGNPFTQNSLYNHWTLMYFGYAECPDVCPTTLAIVSQAWVSFPNRTPHPKARFVFVTLNPAKDTKDNLKTFLTPYHPEFLGVTGSEAEIKALSKAANIYSWRDPNITDKTVIDHSGTLLLFNPEGRLHALFSPPHQIDALKKDFEVLMNR